MSDELVSIVLPTYNRADWLPYALASIQRQTYPHWEVILVDDGSTDGSVDRLPSDSRVRVVRRTHSSNLAALRNAGLRSTSGELIAFQDSDDLWHPDKLATQVSQLARHPDCGWCYGRHRLVDEQGSEVEPRYSFPWQPRQGFFLREMLTTEAGVALQTVVVRRGVALTVGFDERVPWGDDYDFAVRLAMASPACVVDRVVADVREHPGRSTRHRHDMQLWLALAYHRYTHVMKDPGLRDLCRRRAIRTMREYLARARERGELVTAVRQAAAGWWRTRP